MRVLYLYAHPLEESFHAAISRAARDGLRDAGHQVDFCDLYAEGFNPVLSAAERRGYHEVPANRAPVEDYVRRLENAEALVLSFPTWCFGRATPSSSRKDTPGSSTRSIHPFRMAGPGAAARRVLPA